MVVPKGAQFPKKYLLFAGNPGTGKSTLLNCIMNSRNKGIKEEHFFKSGISYGSGMTFQLDIREYDQVVYMDTPGLEDTKKRKEAAAAITEALKKDGHYQVVFVVTLEAGRVRPADITTMTLVLESAREITHYGVIFNKLGKAVQKKMTTETKLKLLSEVSLQGGVNKPVPIPMFLGKYSELDDEDNVRINIPELENYLLTLLPIKINKGNVDDIPTESFEFLKQKMEDELSFLKENNQEMQRKMKEDQEHFKKQLDDILQKEKERHESDKAELKASHDRMLKHMEKQLEQTKEETKKSEAKEKQRHEERMQQMQMQRENFQGMMEQMDKNHQASLAAINNSGGGGGCAIM